MIDAHCHLHEYYDDEIRVISMLGIDIIAVSDDYNSSLKTLAIAEKHRWVIPAVGIHPWNIGADSFAEFNRLYDLIINSRNKVRVIGEVGLDKKFKYETYSYQLQIFKSFIDLATEIKALLNIHAAGAWKETIELLFKSDAPSAIIHWYTGPLELINEIINRNIFISINPAVTIQAKHREVVAQAPLDIILVESDAPYNYRGLSMHPRDVFNVIKHISSIKSMSYEEVYEAIASNYEKLKCKILTY
uniref:TatD family deoxyribonuclease n=1 Tax=Ignisphaera aggregans TaxID=334771 RepID=A0A7C4JJN5_9CREN